MENDTPVRAVAATVAERCWLATLLLCLVVIAGCAESRATSGMTPASSASSTSAVATPTSAGQQSTATVAPTKGSPQATLVLTPMTRGLAGTVAAGHLVQVQLPDSSRWSFSPTATDSILREVAPSGTHVTSLRIWEWTFAASASGSSTLTFVGMSVCPPGMDCAPHSVRLVFTVTVT